MRLWEIVDESCIKVDVESTDKEDAIAELVELLVRAGKVTDRDGVLESLYRREEEGSTGIGQGVAIPHAKHESISELIACIGISREGVDFDATDGEPVHLLLLIMAEPDNPGPHLACLAEIARLIKTQGFTRRITECDTPAKVLEVISGEE